MNWDFEWKKQGSIIKAGHHYQLGFRHRKNKAQQWWSCTVMNWDFGMRKQRSISKAGHHYELGFWHNKNQSSAREVTIMNWDLGMRNQRSKKEKNKGQQGWSLL